MPSPPAHLPIPSSSIPPASTRTMRAAAPALAALALLCSGAHAASAASSIAAGEAVFVADLAGADVTRYDAATATASWATEVPKSRVIDLAFDAAGNVVSAASNTFLSVVNAPGSGWNVVFDVLRAADGEDAGVPPPTVDFGKAPLADNFEGFAVVDGKVAGFFPQPQFREARTVSLPSLEGYSYRTSFVQAKTYLGTGYNFLVALDGGSPTVRNLFKTDVSIVEPPIFAAGAYRLIGQVEPNNSTYNALCGVRLASGGGAVALSAIGSRQLSTPGGAGKSFCGSGQVGFDTLIVQVINRDTLKPTWTTEIPGEYRYLQTAVGVGGGKVVAAATNVNGRVEVITLDASSGKIVRTQRTVGTGADTVKNVHVLSSGKVAVTGRFDGPQGESPVVFFDANGPTVATNSCS